MSEDSELLTLGNFDRHGTTRARWQGRWIEVEHGIPGETVRVEIVGKNRPRGRILEVIEPAPDRIEAPCPYFREWSCGGCQWQHISYGSQLRRKREAIEEAMSQPGFDLYIEGLHTLEEPWRYRSTAGISLGKRAGFRRQASLAIVPIRDCPISHPLIGQLMAALNDLLEAGELPDFRGRVRLDVRVSGSLAESYLQVLVRPEDERLGKDDLSTLAAGLSSMAEIGSVTVAREEGFDTIKGDLFGRVEVAGKWVTLSAASFFQTNLLLLPKLISRLMEEAQPLAGKTVADIYGGIGLFGLFMAETAREVVVIEPDSIALQAGQRTAQEWGLSNVRFMSGRAEEILAEPEMTTSRYDVVIVDPPRSGLTEEAIDQILRIRPPLLLYVSCLPQSLARDLLPLTEGGYRIHGLELFDFYPQTYHTEVLCVLRR